MPARARSRSRSTPCSCCGSLRAVVLVVARKIKGAVVASLIAGISLLDALACAHLGRPDLAIAALVAFVLTIVLQRVVPALNGTTPFSAGARSRTSSPHELVTPMRPSCAANEMLADVEAQAEAAATLHARVPVTLEHVRAGRADSRTGVDHLDADQPAVVRAARVTRPPLAVCLNALSTRLHSTCSTRSRSAVAASALSPVVASDPGFVARTWNAT